MFGAVEAGGTKFVLGIGPAPGQMAAQATIPTRSPAETLEAAAQWFGAVGAPLAAIGIASFGPVELDRASPRWGHITETAKPGWSGCDIAGFFARRFGVPMGFDTDVNGAALAEWRLGAGRGAGSLAYLTVGTGIGGGAVLDGRVLHGTGHPEMGHAFVRRPAGDEGFAGACPFHGDCLEGLASGTAIRARWSASLSELPPEHEAHGLVAGYLAQACHTLFATLAVELVVLGGGVLKTPVLLERVAAEAKALDGGYLPGGARQQVVAPQLAPVSGLYGAMLLAEEASRA